MTHLDLYSNALIEQNKLEAPTLLIEDYNYLINKAILQYINLTYARFDLNQQTSDDLRWLQRSVELDVFRQDRIIHPMEEDHFIEFIAYECGNMMLRYKLSPNDEPECEFPYLGKGTIYAYCNKHGLWKKDIE